MTEVDHLALAKEDLAIAESGDAKREAYERAAGHIVAYRDESKDGKYRQTAASYCNTSLATVDKLVQWHKTGFKAETPFLADDQATTRAAKSHTKAVLKNPEQRKAVIESLTAEERRAVEKDIHEKDDKDFFADPDKRKGHQRAEQAQFEDEAHKRTWRAWMNLGARWHYYGDTPFTELEVQQRQQMRMILDAMDRGEEMDDDLKELVANASK